MKEKKISLTKMLAITALLVFAGWSLAAAADFTLSSTAVTGKSETGFSSGLKSAGRIDAQFAAKPNEDANKTSFPFDWKNLPEGTKALALILDDPDAKPVMAVFGMKGDSFLHWIAADIDPAKGGLKKNASADKPDFPQGKNGGGMTGYMGPRPPSDIPKDAKPPLIHIYRLTVYALSAPTGLKDGFSLEDLTAAIKDKTLGQAQLFMSYNN